MDCHEHINLVRTTQISLLECWKCMIDDELKLLAAAQSFVTDDELKPLAVVQDQTYI